MVWWSWSLYLRLCICTVRRLREKAKQANLPFPLPDNTPQCNDDDVNLGYATRGFQDKEAVEYFQYGSYRPHSYSAGSGLLGSSFFSARLRDSFQPGSRPLNFHHVQEASSTTSQEAPAPGVWYDYRKQVLLFAAFEAWHRVAMGLSG